MISCWFHRWGRWERLCIENLTVHGGIIGQRLVQIRKCERCGLEQIIKQTVLI